MNAPNQPPPLMLYALGLGSNQRHPVHGAPSDVLRAALRALDCEAIEVLDSSTIIASLPIGPSSRRYANSAALIATTLRPPQLLEHLKKIESQFGKRRGQRWSARVLDVDILLWSDGIWSDERLNIPHLQMATRDFVLAPLAEICPKWRHPVDGRHIRQILSQLLRRYPVDQSATSH